METIEGILMQKLVTQAYFVMHTATTLGLSFSENRCCFSFVLGKIAVKYLLNSAFFQFLCPDVIFATYSWVKQKFLAFSHTKNFCCSDLVLGISPRKARKIPIISSFNERM
jgi:hypothetical protein